MSLKGHTATGDTTTGAVDDSNGGGLGLDGVSALVLTSRMGPWACPWHAHGSCRSELTDCSGANPGGNLGTAQANPCCWLTPTGSQLTSCQAPHIILSDAAFQLWVLSVKQENGLINVPVGHWRAEFCAHACVGENAVPRTGHAQSILKWDSLVRDSFTEAALFSAWDQSATSPVLHKQRRRSLRRTTNHRQQTLVCASQRLHLSDRHDNACAREHVLFCFLLTRAVVATQSHNKPHNWHANSSRRSIVHLSRERTAPRDLKLNLSQTLHSFWLHSKAHNFHLQTTQKACSFQRSASSALAVRFLAMLFPRLAASAKHMQ